MVGKLIQNSILAVIGLLALIPALIWFSSSSIPDRFTDPYSALRSLGQLSALVGTVLFSVNIVLATRLKFLDRVFNGLNNAYVYHHLIGGLAFILLLIHPIVLAISLLPAGARTSSAFLLLDTGYSAKDFGFWALLLMIILLVLTYYYRPRYHIWKLSHKFLGFAFFLASTHAYLIPSDIGRSLPLRSYMLLVISIGLASAVYRSVLSGGRKYRYFVKSISRLNQNVTEIVLEPQTQTLSCEPGQFVFISFVDKSLGRESHPFSVTSAAADKPLSLAVKSLGDYTDKIGNLQNGCMALIEGPFGKFNFLNFENKNQVWIAGGIGITPFLSMARSLKNENGYSITLFYSVKTEDEAVYLDELQKISATVGGFKVVPFVSSKQGRLSAKAIRVADGNLSGKDFLICGPPAMMGSLRSQLLSAGVGADRIHTEEFDLL